MTRIEKLNAMASLYNKVPVEQRNGLIKKIIEHIRGIIINNTRTWPTQDQSDMEQWIYYALISALNKNTSENFYSYFISHIMKARNMFKESKKWFTYVPVKNEDGTIDRTNRWREQKVKSLNVPCGDFDNGGDWIDFIPDEIDENYCDDLKLNFNISLSQSTQRPEGWHMQVVKDYMLYDSVTDTARKNNTSHETVRCILKRYIKKSRRIHLTQLKAEEAILS